MNTPHFYRKAVRNQLQIGGEALVWRNHATIKGNCANAPHDFQREDFCQQLAGFEAAMREFGLKVEG